MGLKYAILVGDGMADYPIPELDNRTPLQYASTPHMDTIASSGTVGLVATVPEGFAPGSDVANLSLMGYEPRHYYSGRAPIEAASMGITLSPQDTAFRCNLVTIENGIMIDYSAGHIETETANKLINELKAKMPGALSLYPGVGYRHLLVIADFPKGLHCTPPHDITDKPVNNYLPRGSGAEMIIDLSSKAHEILANSPINAAQLSQGKRIATDIWLWGQGHAVTLPSLQKRYGLSGSVISAVDLVRGLGILSGLTNRIVQGATGYLGTNYKGKVQAAIDALTNEDFVYVHIEAPDETSHEGSLQKKIQAIEEFDREIVGEMIRFQQQQGNVRLLVAPDHATPVSLKTHSCEPVPYAISGPGICGTSAHSYSENSARNSTIVDGPRLFDYLIKGQ
jgi:2,3-bisphosphoglycerate-independent phosphoglycerate mutase